MSNELTDLPENWLLVPLSKITTKLIDGSHNPPSKQEEGFPMLSARNIDAGKINFTNYRLIEKKAFELEDARTRIIPGDVLLTIVGAIGRSAVVPEKIERFTLQRSVAVITPIAVIPEFLMYQFDSPKIQQELLNKAKGTAQKGIYLKALGSIGIIVPPLNEQKRIVAKIEALRERSRKAREALEEIPALCDRFRQSVLAAAFRGDLTADWREQNPDVEPASVLLERIKAERKKRWEEKELEKMKAKGKVPEDDKWKSKYKEPAKIDEAELPDLPDGWFWLSADEITSLITDGEHATPERSNDGVYLLSARNILNGKVSLENVDYIPENVYCKLEERFRVEPGDVFLSCSGTVGRSCVVPSDLRCALVRSVAILKPLLEMGEYLSLAIRSPYVQSQIERKKTQTAQSNIFQGRIKILGIPVAPLNEQKIIVQTINQAFNFIESVEKTLQDIEIQQLCLDQSILAKAFRGELVPQDPNDEPASILLERIKAEREKLGEKKKTPRKSSASKSGKTQTKTLITEQMTIPGIETETEPE